MRFYTCSHKFIPKNRCVFKHFLMGIFLHTPLFPGLLLQCVGIWYCFVVFVNVKWCQKWLKWKSAAVVQNLIKKTTHTHAQWKRWRWLKKTSAAIIEAAAAPKNLKEAVKLSWETENFNWHNTTRQYRTRQDKTRECNILYSMHCCCCTNSFLFSV